MLAILYGRHIWTGTCDFELAVRGEVDRGVEEDLAREQREVRIELRSRVQHHVVDRLLERHRQPVRPDRRHRVDRVGDREQPCCPRDVFAAQPVRVPAAVPSFVVVTDDLSDTVGEPERSDDPFAEDRVGVQDASFGVGERPRLVEDRLGDADLADVVEQEARFDRFARHRILEQGGMRSRIASRVTRSAWPPV